MHSFSPINKLSAVIVILIMLFTACKQPGALPESGVSKTLAEERKVLVSSVSYKLDMAIPENPQQVVPATVTITFRLSGNTQDLLLDFKAEKGAVKDVHLNAKKQAIQHVHEHIILNADALIQGENTVTIKFDAGSGALNRNKEYMYALFVPDRARTTFPCFDQPDIKASFQLALEIPAEWTAMSNAPLDKIESGTDLIPMEANKAAATDHSSATPTKIFRFQPSDTISTYLFSFTAGKYKSESVFMDGREMTFFHRETDSVKIATSMTTIFNMHAQSIAYMEKYTGIPYPFKKFDFVAIPDFQFGGMEHPGAMWYNAGLLFLEPHATQTQLIKRANLIAHETSHIWFGDLVTMTWFDDVWMKEVFANFMADKIVEIILPDNNAALKFVLAHYPPAYAVDRTRGANPIRQPLENLQEAGSLYGNIIYHKSPIMMLQLETLIGKDALQQGLQQYLKNYAFSNASWPDLIAILDAASDKDLQQWNDQWVNKAGMPHYNYALTDTNLNTYGVFTIDTTTIRDMGKQQEPVQKAYAYLNLYENMLDGNYITPSAYLQLLRAQVATEQNNLILQQLLDQLVTVYWAFIDSTERNQIAPALEKSVWARMQQSPEQNIKRILFKAYQQIAVSAPATTQLYAIWKKEFTPEAMRFSEDDYTQLAAALALRSIPQTSEILNKQLAAIENTERKQRFAFLMPALAMQQETRDTFFNSLISKENRSKESWVNTALTYLHHPLRGAQSEKYLQPSLELLEEIKTTGDIFFPQNWLQAIFAWYRSPEAKQTVANFLAAHPQYNERLKNKILQATDNLYRAVKLQEIATK